ncbi:MAG: hypothetical protein ACSLE5_08745, partial [Porticoccaceae bacterium]
VDEHRALWFFRFPHLPPHGNEDPYSDSRTYAEFFSTLPGGPDLFPLYAMPHFQNPLRLPPMLLPQLPSDR